MISTFQYVQLGDDHFMQVGDHRFQIAGEVDAYVQNGNLFQWCIDDKLYGVQAGDLETVRELYPENHDLDGHPAYAFQVAGQHFMQVGNHPTPLIQVGRVSHFTGANQRIAWICSGRAFLYRAGENDIASFKLLGDCQSTLFTSDHFFVLTTRSLHQCILAQTALEALNNCKTLLLSSSGPAWNGLEVVNGKVLCTNRDGQYILLPQI